MNNKLEYCFIVAMGYLWYRDDVVVLISTFIIVQKKLKVIFISLFHWINFHIQYTYIHHRHVMYNVLCALNKSRMNEHDDDTCNFFLLFKFFSLNKINSYFNPNTNEIANKFLCITSSVLYSFIFIINDDDYSNVRC